MGELAWGVRGEGGAVGSVGGLPVLRYRPLFQKKKVLINVWKKGNKKRRQKKKATGVGRYLVTDSRREGKKSRLKKTHQKGSTKQSRDF